MASTFKRVVRIASAVYVDASGRTRRASMGADVEVHADDVSRFDHFNGGAPIEAPASVAKSTRRSKATVEE